MDDYKMDDYDLIAAHAAGYDASAVAAAGWHWQDVWLWQAAAAAAACLMGPTEQELKRLRRNAARRARYAARKAERKAQ